MAGRLALLTVVAVIIDTVAIIQKLVTGRRPAHLQDCVNYVQGIFT